MSLFQISTIEEYDTACKNAFENPETFWDDIASHYQWQKRWSKTLNWNFKEPKITWYHEGKLNITENCLDRHLKNNGETIALIWEPNNPKEPEIRMTYDQLHLAVCKFSNVLKSKGIKKGDRVAIYMPMIPELTIGVLACARIGAIHSVVFAGFSSQALADRINDSKCCAVLTSDGMYRGSKNLAVKTTVDQALKSCTSVKTVVVIKRDNSDIKMMKTRDIWYHEAEQEVSDHCPAEPMDSEDMLFILYTSGSTGKPKGIVHLSLIHI